MGFGSLIGATLATATGWIIYSKRFINHNFKLAGALETDRWISNPNAPDG